MVLMGPPMRPAPPPPPEIPPRLRAFSAARAVATGPKLARSLSRTVYHLLRHVRVAVHSTRLPLCATCTMHCDRNITLQPTAVQSSGRHDDGRPRLYSRRADSCARTLQTHIIIIIIVRSLRKPSSADTAATAPAGDKSYVFYIGTVEETMTTRVRVCARARENGPSDAWRHGAFIRTMACDNIILYKARLRRVMKYTHTHADNILYYMDRETESERERGDVDIEWCGPFVYDAVCIYTTRAMLQKTACAQNKS